MTRSPAPLQPAESHAGAFSAAEGGSGRPKPPVASNAPGAPTVPRPTLAAATGVTGRLRARGTASPLGATAGRCYLERGHPVTVLVGFGDRRGVPAATARFLIPGLKPAQKAMRLGPKNILIRRHTGELAVRGLYGLRLPKETL